MIWELLLKTIIPVPRFLIINFPGMFENPAPAKYYLKKQNQKYYDYIMNYIRIRWNIIDDYWL